MNELLANAVLFAIPLAICAYGGLIHRASGVVNIGLEGQMLIGALMGVVVSGAAGSWTIGILAGALAGMIASYLMTLLIIRLAANEIIVGLGMNIVITGLIGFVLKSIMGSSNTLRIPNLQTIPVLNIDWLGQIPVLGPILNGRDPVFVLAIILIPVTSYLLKNTRFGLRLRAAGDSEYSAESIGLNAKGMREYAGMIAGACAGLAGAYLALGIVGFFNSEMIAGRGFIALAAFYFGRKSPLMTALACLVFAGFDSLQLTLQSSSVFGQLASTVPYISVVIILVISAVRENRPYGRLRLRKQST